MLELYKVVNDKQITSLGFFDNKESVEEFVGQDLIEVLLVDATYLVLYKGGFVGCFTKWMF